MNFQRPFQRTDDGFETLDHELDMWSRDLRTWHWDLGWAGWTPPDGR